jgi:hypothetical protein
MNKNPPITADAVIGALRDAKQAIADLLGLIKKSGPSTWHADIGLQIMSIERVVQAFETGEIVVLGAATGDQNTRETGAAVTPAVSDDMALVRVLALRALQTDGAHHKQWFLERILEATEARPSSPHRDWTPGVAP